METNEKSYYYTISLFQILASDVSWGFPFLFQLRVTVLVLFYFRDDLKKKRSTELAAAEMCGVPAVSQGETIAYQS